MTDSSKRALTSPTRSCDQTEKKPRTEETLHSQSIPIVSLQNPEGPTSSSTMASELTQHRGGRAGRFRGRGRGGSGRGRGGHQSHRRGSDHLANAPAEVIDLFNQCSEALDNMNDKRERIIKISRDITIGSKRMIFLLHRAAGSDRSKILSEAKEKLAEIVQLFRAVAVELKGNDFYKHHRSIGPGYEEFIEAVSFLVYVERGELVTKDELQKLLVDDAGGQILRITEEDYILGLADLTGELMRYCINTVARGEHEHAEEICRFLRKLKAEYETLDFPPARRKMGTMRGSLSKVENACYALKIRGAEYPPEKFADELLDYDDYQTWQDAGNEWGRGDY